VNKNGRSVINRLWQYCICKFNTGEDPACDRESLFVRLLALRNETETKQFQTSCQTVLKLFGFSRNKTPPAATICELHVVSVWLMVMHPYSCYFPLSLSLSHRSLWPHKATTQSTKGQIPLRHPEEDLLCRLQQVEAQILQLCVPEKLDRQVSFRHSMSSLSCRV